MKLFVRLTLIVLLVLQGGNVFDYKFNQNKDSNNNDIIGCDTCVHAVELTFTLEKTKKFCFREVVVKLDTKITLEYQVVHGGE